ncbi:cysteine proteinase inhibitor 8 [Striga asiatica]|uniref:Cysteine proteinase inhibitor 8 n=1 Tax=Striga asiatica TaxID=4170 RepID=A0A5A7RGP3_STRAF|nr:cysteine proteinase inhibitor 8 [Striga asiatica]
MSCCGSSSSCSVGSSGRVPWKPILKPRDSKVVGFGKFAASEYSKTMASNNEYLDFKSVTQGATRQVGSRLYVWIEIRARDLGHGGSTDRWRMDLYEEGGEKYLTSATKINN